MEHNTGPPPDSETEPRTEQETDQRPRDSPERRRDDLATLKKLVYDSLEHRDFPQAAAYHLKSIQLRQQFSDNVIFPRLERIKASIMQVKILLRYWAKNGNDRSLLPPDVDALLPALQECLPLEHASCGLLCAEIGLLHMRLSTRADWERAKHYLDLSVQHLLELQPIPLSFLIQTAQDLADVYDLLDDSQSVDELKERLGRKMQPEFSSQVQIHRLRDAWRWCADRGFNVEAFDARDPSKGESPLEHAVKERSQSEVEAMLSYTTRITPQNKDLASYLLLLAGNTRSVDMAKYLLESGAQVNVLDDLNRTVLHRCQNCPALGNKGGLSLANFLLEKDPSLLDRQDKFRKTALYMACESGHVEMTKLLLQHGAQPNLADIHGKTPLHLACEKGHLGTVQALLEGDADPNAQGPGACTPLIVAVKMAGVKRDRVDIVQEMMRYKADPHIRDSTGRNSFDHATGLFASRLKQLLKGDHPQSSSTTSVASPSSRELPTVALRRGTADKASDLARNFSRISITPSLLSSRASESSRSTLFSSVFSRSRNTLNTDCNSLSSLSEEMLPETATPVCANESAKGSPLSPYRQNTPTLGQSDASLPEPPQPGDLRYRNDPSQNRQRSESSIPRMSDDRSDQLGDHASVQQQSSTPRPQVPAINEPRSSVDTYDDESTDTASDTTSEFSDSDDHGPLDGNQSLLGLRNMFIKIISDAYQNSSGPSQTQYGVGRTSDGVSPGSSRGSAPDRHDNASAAQRHRRKNLHRAGRNGGRKTSDATQETESSQEGRLLFACPYAKWNPARYHACNHNILSKISHVKQHLRRKHRRPAYCSRCGQEFGGDQPERRRDQHIRMCDIVVDHFSPPDGLSEEQIARFAERVSCRDSPEKQWYSVYSIIFGDDSPRPHSPYVDPDLVAPFHGLYDFARDRGRLIAREMLRSRGQSGQEAAQMEDIIIAVLEDMITAFSHELQRQEAAGTDGQLTSLSNGNLMGRQQPDSEQFDASTPDTGMTPETDSSNPGELPSSLGQSSMHAGNPNSMFDGFGVEASGSGMPINALQSPPMSSWDLFFAADPTQLPQAPTASGFTQDHAPQFDFSSAGFPSMTATMPMNYSHNMDFAHDPSAWYREPALSSSMVPGPNMDLMDDTEESSGFSSQTPSSKPRLS